MGKHEKKVMPKNNLNMLGIVLGMVFFEQKKRD